MPITRPGSPTGRAAARSTARYTVDPGSTGQLRQLHAGVLAGGVQRHQVRLLPRIQLRLLSAQPALAFATAVPCGSASARSNTHHNCHYGASVFCPFLTDP